MTNRIAINSLSVDISSRASVGVLCSCDWAILKPPKPEATSAAEAPETIFATRAMSALGSVADITAMSNLVR